MKTTSSKVIAKKLQKMVDNKKLSKSTLVYKWVSSLNTGDMLRPVFSQGTNWRHSSLVDKSSELIDVLKMLGLEYSIGNDAPRGGTTGYYVQINTKINK